MAFAAPASAGILTVSATDCQDGALTQPFRAWGDFANYKLVGGDAFEPAATGWTLRGGAKVVSGNEPWKVRSPGDSRSLHLPAGSSATTPPVCVGVAEPTLRSFAKRNRGLLSTLAVTVWVKTSLGLEVPLPIGVMLPNGSQGFRRGCRSWRTCCRCSPATARRWPSPSRRCSASGRSTTSSSIRRE